MACPSAAAQEYPNHAPHVLITSRLGSAVRFNPNLYSCGKVCLSLLGTWQGPGWEPGRSTIYQVLMSIQTQVLNKFPLENEPGYERVGGVCQLTSCPAGSVLVLTESTASCQCAPGFAFGS